MKKLVFILAFCLPLLAQANSEKIDFVEYKLDNGLHVILQEDHTTPNIVVSVMYHVGSKNEKPELTGFAHFFEHLMFEGTKNIKRHEFDKYVTRVGGNLNANTFSTAPIIMNYSRRMNWHWAYGWNRNACCTRPSNLSASRPKKMSFARKWGKAGITAPTDVC